MLIGVAAGTADNVDIGSTVGAVIGRGGAVIRQRILGQVTDTAGTTVQTKVCNVCLLYTSDAADDYVRV